MEGVGQRKTTLGFLTRWSLHPPHFFGDQLIFSGGTSDNSVMLLLRALRYMHSFFFHSCQLVACHQI